MKIGKYWIPTNRLEALLAATKKIYEATRGDETSAELIADVLKHSPNSGTFGTKMGDLRTYGLIEGRGEKITVTDLGKQATTFGDERERNEALQRIVRNVELWRILLDKYGVNIKKENFWLDLVKITGADRLDAKNKEAAVRKAYLEAVEYIKSVGEPIQTPLIEEMGEMETADRTVNMEAQPISGQKAAILYIKYPDNSETRYQIKTEKDYELGEMMYKAIRSKLDFKESRSEEDKDLATKILAAIQSVLDVRKKDAKSESGEDKRPEKLAENEASPTPVD
jgi:hypothetical protein